MNIYFGSSFLQKFVLRGLIGNYWGFVQAMDWDQIGAKPAPEPMSTKVCEAIWHN